ncbi:hypothetical protein EZS27_005663, partial [termite gut metagenome]
MAFSLRAYLICCLHAGICRLLFNNNCLVSNRVIQLQRYRISSIFGYEDIVASVSQITQAASQINVPTVEVIGEMKLQLYVAGAHQGWDPAAAPIVYSRNFDMKYDGYV